MFKQKFTVTPEESGIRIDTLCAQKFTKISRSRWTKWGEFKRNDVVKSSKTKTKMSDVWEVLCETESLNHDLEPWDFDLEVLEETDDWVVINKPYGVSVHPSVSESGQKTMVNALLHHFGKNLAENFDEIEGRKVPRPGLVHRLDKTTSGVLLVAKTNETHAFFQKNWPKVEKYYLALVSGRPPERGKIESGIIRDNYDRKKMMASDREKSKWAITEFEKIEQRDDSALLKVKILTGRTHQIRVHLSSIGFPVMGDVLYGGIEAERVMLHAESLKFLDSESGKEVLVESGIEF